MTERCRYCGKEIEKQGVLYCDRTCFRLFLSVTANLVIENSDKMNDVDKFLLVDLPLQSYNKFFSRDVKEKDYTDALKEIRPKNLPIEYKILGAYYTASRKNKDTYFPLSMMRSSLSTQKMFREMTSIVFKSETYWIDVKSRLESERRDFISKLVSMGKIDAVMVNKANVLHGVLKMDDYMVRPGDGISTAYVELLVSGATIRQEDVETAMRKKMVTVRKSVNKIIDDLRKKKKIVLDGRFVSNIKNLSSATIS